MSINNISAYAHSAEPSCSSAASKSSEASASTTTSTLKTRKGLSYVIGNTNNNDNHILPINAVQYSKLTNQLYTAGRDGTVKVWNHNISNKQQETTMNNNTDDENHEHFNDYQDLDEKLLRLETSISSNPIPYNLTSFENNFQIVNNYSNHFDWINDIQLINDDKTLVSCSADLSIKIIDLMNATTDVHFNTKNACIHKFPNVHTDYIKKLSYSNRTPNQIISGGLDGKVVVWDLNNLKPTQVIENKPSGSLPSSIYSLANNNSSLISAGGPNNTINIFDQRTSSPFIKKLIGHQDTIRCLLMSDRFILSGSSDTTIKLWDLRTFKVYKNFDIHDCPVWSMTAETCSISNDFSQFYSGDKEGNIIKTDLSYISTNVTHGEHFFDTFTPSENLQLDEKLGISTIVAKGDSPILSICLETNEDTIFTSNYESLTRFVNPNTNQLAQYQYLRNCLDYSISRDAQLKDELASGLGDNATIHTGGAPQNDDLNSDFYDLISHLSTETVANINDLQSTFSHVHSGEGTPPTDHAVDGHGDDHDYNSSSDNDDDENGLNKEDYTSMFLNVNGGPSHEFINAFQEDIEFENFNFSEETPNIHITLMKATQSSNSQAISMGTRSSIQRKQDNSSKSSISNEFLDLTPIEILLNPIPQEQITSVPFNTKPISEFDLIPKSVVSKRVFNNKRHVIVLYRNGDIKIWDLLTCTQLKFYPGECSDVMLTNKEIESRLRDLDSYYQKEQGSDTLNNWCDVEIKSGKLMVTIKEGSLMNSEIYYDTLVADYPFLSVDDPVNQARYHGNKIKYNVDDRYQIGSILLKSFFKGYSLYEWQFDCLLREELRHSSKFNKSLDIENDASSLSNSLRKLKSFGRKSHKHDLSNGSGQSTPTGNGSTNASFIDIPAPNLDFPMSEFISMTEDQLNKMSNDYDNSIMKFLHSNKKYYMEKCASIGTKKLDSLLNVDRIHPYINEELTGEIQYSPVVDIKYFPQDLLVIIFEYAPDLGNYRDCLSFQLRDIDKLSSFTTQKIDLSFINDLRLLMPSWLGDPILYNKYPLKEAPKIAFQLLEYDYGTLSPNIKIGGKSQKKIKKLPNLNGSINLTSHNMLRVSKILGYLVEKFESKTSEMKDKKLSPVDWLVLECRGEELQPDMTLQTIKTKLWKSNTDVELRYRRKFDGV
ncbi:uncharacterized protein J8A68_003714 [[Candida] subhashii]|uniref:TEP-1 C-terminal beta-propeller domain-containing protein n=1 Tax=[Candida] subhashii TaxID=561895 RepID=A0A8J5ULF2_9ASCO|nr:uncharacterized protein J8A68_003714 [[Candida] subhashii]KAG7662791.1 hypothetical protein J8A68_003714 [[Candida] subhashii]